MESALYIGTKANKLSPKEIVVQENGLLAINYLNKQETAPSIIFCEEKIKGINAYDLCKKVKNELGLKQTVFILIKQLPTNINPKQFLEIGIDEVIREDSNQTDIIPRIKFLLKFKKEDQKNTKVQKQEERMDFMKRGFDIIVALIALVMLSPVFILTAIALRIESSDPIFYSSKRVGSKYKIFDFYKFRSMVVGASEKLQNVKT